MQSVIVENKLNFCKSLFFGQVFDDFLFLEGSIITNCSYTIDGRLQKTYYTSEEYDSLTEPKIAVWKDIKPFFTTVVGDKFPDKLPVEFNITLTLSATQTEKLIASSSSDIVSENVEGLHLNIKYKNDTLTCITATSLKIFTLDKSLEHYFDKYTANFLGRF